MTSDKPHADQPLDKNRDDTARQRDPRAELGLKSPISESSEQGDDLKARQNEPYGPGQYRSGIDKPGEPTKKNPGHTNPQHNTPGRERHDKPDAVDDVASDQAGPAHYPGIRGAEAQDLAQHSKPPTEPPSEKHPETIPAPRKDDAPG